MRITESVRRVHSGSKGQGAAEFIIITPMILFLFIIVVDFSLALRDWIMVSNGVREGARLGALGGFTSEDEIRQRVVDRSDGIVPAAEVNVSYSGTDRGDSVIVQTDHEYAFRFLARIFPIDPSITLSTCADMRLEVAAIGATGGGVPCSSP